MANREEEPQSCHQQFSVEYLAKHGHPGPVTEVVESPVVEDVQSIPDPYPSYDVMSTTKLKDAKNG